jgi:RHS repeat-associated protein
VGIPGSPSCDRVSQRSETPRWSPSGVDSDTGDNQRKPPSDPRGTRLEAAGTRPTLDRFGRVKDACWHKASGSVDVARIQYGYDRASNRSWRYDAVARSQSKSLDELYQYDGLQRLKSLDRGKLDTPRTGLDSGSGSFGECWTLDETGNWKGYRRDYNGDGSWDVVQSRTSNAVNEIVATTGTPAPAYDAAGNMTSLGSGGGTGWAELTLNDWSDLELSEWAAMPLTSGGATGLTATYDAWNRLVKLSRETETARTYHYDGRKYRIAVGSYTAGSLASTRHFYYSTGWRVLEERVVLAAAASGAETTTPPERQFVWGTRYIDDLVLRDRDVDGNSTLEERKYALQDANWNVIALTDESGAVDERYAYSAYGAAAILNPSFTPVGTGTSAFDWETLYAGYRYEPATELFHVRNRVYSPGLGVWLQRDADESGWNYYEYSNGMPIDQVDPYGLESYGWGQYLSDTAGAYGQGVGDVFSGYGDAAVGTVSGTWKAVTNPWQTAKGVASAAASPIQTGKAICNEIYEKSQTNRGCGELAGDLLIGAATGGALKTLSKTEKVARIVRKADNAVPDCGAPTPPTTGAPSPNRGGRLGKPSTRKHVIEVADELENRGWKSEHGGGRGPEEYIPGPGGARKGSAYPDITATKGRHTLRVNTIDTLVDGITPDAREARNAAKIRALRPGDHLLTIPKPQ